MAGISDETAALLLRCYSSGVDGLDTMTRGGWLRNSIIIVRGPTGSGKTMLAGLYARAGASCDERVVYYGFEETRPILLRNYREIGMEMRGSDHEQHPYRLYIEPGGLRTVKLTPGEAEEAEAMKRRRRQ